MATTEHFYSGTGTQTSFPFQFPYLTESDIFVKLYNTETGEFDLLQQNTSGLNHDYSISNTNIVFNTAPPQVAGIDNIHIYRTTDVEIAKAVYGTGSAIRAQDLNNNTNQALFRLQESDQLITTGDIKNGAITEAKLAPNSVTTVHIRNGTIIDEDVSATAAIQGSKIVPNFGVQNIIGDGSQIINPNPNFGNQTITTDLHITAQGNITAAGDLSIDDITASGDMTIDNITAQGDITAARFFGDGSGLTGITFTGIDQFLRRDIDDTASGNITFANNIKIPAASTDQETYPDGQNGSLDGFDKGNIFWNYPENPIGSRAFKSSAWLYLKERNYNYGPTFPSLELHVGEYGSNLGAEFTITTEGQSHCIRFDTNGTNITNYPLRIHNYNGIQWEFRNGSPSFQIHCTSAYGSNPDTYMINSRGTLFIKSGLDIEFTDKGAATNGNNEFFTSTQLKIKSYHDDDDELDLVNGEGYNGGHVELYSNNTKRFETDIFGCVVHNNIRIPTTSSNASTDWNYQIFNSNSVTDNGYLIFGDKPDRSATSPADPMEKNNWFYHFYSPGGALNSERKSTTTFQLGAVATSQVPRGIFEIIGNSEHLVTFSKKEKSGTKFDAPVEIGYSNLGNPDVDEGSTLKWGLHSLYGATPTPSLEIRCNNPNSTGNTSSYITNRRDDLYIQAGGVNGHGLIIEEFGSNPNTIAKFISDNSGDQTSGDALYGGAVELYAEGTKRFETNSTGAKVTGTLEVFAGTSINTPEILFRGGGPNFIRFSSNDAPVDQSDDIDFVYRADPNTIGFERVSDTKKLFLIDADTEEVQIPTDTGKLQLGASQDLEIYHDGTQSLILDNGTGQLRIGGENTIAITNAAGTESYARFIKDSQVELFYDNVKRFETTSTGVKVSGDFSFCGTSDNEHIRFDAGADHLKFEDNIAAKFGSDSDLQIYHDGSNSYIKDGGTGALRVLTSTLQIKNTADTQSIATFIPQGAANLFYDGSKKLETTSSGVTVTGDFLSSGDGNRSISLLDTGHGFGSSSLSISNGGRDLDIKAPKDIRLKPTDGENGIVILDNGAVELYYDNVKRVETTSTGVSITGHLNLPDHVSGTGKIKLGDDNDLQIYHDGSNSFINDQGTGGLKIQSNQTDIVNSSNSEFVAKFIANGAVELYYDSAKKFQTTSYGVLATGTIVTTTGNIRCQTDSGKITAGVGHDIQIYHDGLGSKIENQTGSLNINTASSEIWLSKDTSEYLARFITDGGVELYNDGVKHFETTSVGWKSNDNVKGVFGSDGDLQIYHSGSHSFIKQLPAATGNLYIDADGTHSLVLRSGDGSTGRQQAITCFASGGTALYYAGTKHFETTTEGAKTTGSLGVNTAPDSPLHIYDTAATLITAQRNGTGNAVIRFRNDTESMYCGLTTNATGFAIDNDNNLGAGPNLFVDRSTGNVGINSSSPTEALYVNGNVALPDSDEIQLGTGADLQIFHDATNSIIKNNTGILVIRSDQLRVRNQFGSEDYIMMNADGEVKLTYDGVKKFETTSTGAKITGVLEAVGTGQTMAGFKVPDYPNDSTADAYGYFSAGNNEDLQIFHDGQNSIIQDNGAGELLFQRGSNTILSLNSAGIEVTDPNGTAVVSVKGYEGGHARIELKADEGDDAGDIWRIQSQSNNNDLTIFNNTNGVNNYSTKWRLLTDSTVVQKGGLKLPDNAMVMIGGTADNSGDLSIYHNGTDSRIENGTGELQINTRSKIRLEAMNSSLVDETMLLGTLNDAVKLYYDDTLKFETTGNGTKASGSAHVVEGTSSTNFTVQTSALSSATTTLELRGSRTTATTTAISKIDFTTFDNANTSTYNHTMPMGRIGMFKQQGSTNRGRLKIDLNNVSGNNIANVFDLESDGDLTITGALQENSDRRLKSDIVTISDALTKVNNLRGVEYTKIASGKKEIGVIAQEVQTVFPELVKTGDDEDKTLSVKYGHLTAALIEAVKELTTEVNTLKTKVAALEAA